MAQDVQPADITAEPALALTPDEWRLVRAVLDALRRVQHGSVQLVVQDSKVVQIDTTEKIRLTRS